MILLLAGLLLGILIGFALGYYYCAKVQRYINEEEVDYNI